MRRILASILLVMSISSLAMATWYVDESINKSSFTQTADSFVNLSTRANDSMFGIVVASASNGQITIFDGTNAPFISTIGVVNCNQVQDVFFNVQVASGITYNTGLNACTNGVTILYRKRQPN